MQISGKVHEVGTTQNVTDTFKKREIIIEYAEKAEYPEWIKFEAHKDTCGKLDELKVGDNVTVHFNLRGRPWTDKSGKTAYFNTLALWKFDINQTVAGEKPETAESIANSAPEPDDLPW